MRPQLFENGQYGTWYLVLIDAPVHRTLELHPHLLLDLDAEGRLVGVEGLGPVQWPTDTVGFWRVYDAGRWMPMPLSDIEED